MDWRARRRKYRYMDGQMGSWIWAGGRDEKKPGLMAGESVHRQKLTKVRPSPRQAEVTYFLWLSVKVIPWAETLK